MRTSPSLLTATRVTALLHSAKDDVERMGELDKGSPADGLATRALIEGLGWWQWRLVLGCARALGRSTECREEAVRALSQALHHPESSVRKAAATSLGQLAEHVPVPVPPLLEAYLQEESHLAFLEMGKALLVALQGAQLSPQQGARLRQMLEQMEAVRLTHLPLTGELVRRGPAPSPPSVGLLTRLLGKAPRPEPQPRIPAPEDRVFLELEDGRLHDFPEIVSQVAELYATAEDDPEQRFALILRLCRMPLAYFSTSTQLVLLAGRLADSAERKARLLAEQPHWKTPGDPTRGARLACSLASAQPSLRVDLFRQLLHQGAHMDWSNWCYPLCKVPAAELEPVREAALAAPEEELESWLKLLSEAPVEPILPVLARALHSESYDLVKSSLAGLTQYGQPVGEILGDIERLKKRWEEFPSVLQGLQSLVGQSTRPTGHDAALPEGFREPSVWAEWTLNPTSYTPFSRQQRQDWKESLRQLGGFSPHGETLFLTTNEEMVVLRPGQAPQVVPWPDGLHGLGLSFLAAGVEGELLFQCKLASSAYLYLWNPSSGFQKVEPSLPDDEVPSQSNLVSDGRSYGWAEKNVWKMSHFEADPGHHTDIAYRLDRARAAVQPVKEQQLSGMRPVDGHEFSTRQYMLPELQFAYSADGAFRLCAELGLALRTDYENPIHSVGRGQGDWALQLDVFPSRRCRLSLWR